MTGSAELRATATLAALLLCAGATGVQARDGADQPASTVSSEFDAPAPAADESPVGAVPSVDFRLEVSGEGIVFADVDMQDIYEVIPLVRVGLTAEFSPNLQVLFALGYGRRRADLDLGDRTFDATHELEFELVPMRIGFRTNTTPLQSFRLNLGLFLDAVHMKETAPYYRTYPVLESGIGSASGWGTRVSASFGPEWRSRDDRWSLGAEIEGGFGGGEIGGDPTRDIPLSGFAARVLCGVKLGTLEEPAPEVTP